jgi:hypothetical protein
MKKLLIALLTISSLSAYCYDHPSQRKGCRGESPWNNLTIVKNEWQLKDQKIPKEFFGRYFISGGNFSGALKADFDISESGIVSYSECNASLTPFDIVKNITQSLRIDNKGNLILFVNLKNGLQYSKLKIKLNAEEENYKMKIKNFAFHEGWIPAGQTSFWMPLVRKTDFVPDRNWYPTTN